jgi:hypothetical protein
VFPNPVTSISSATSSSSSLSSSAVFTVPSTTDVSSPTQTRPSSDIYNLYIAKVCQGKFTNDRDPESKFVTTGCFSYSDKTNGLGRILVNITSAMSSSILVGHNTSVIIPAITGVKRAFASVAPTIVSCAKAMFALVVIRIIASSLTLAGSALLFVDIRRFVVFTMLTFATLANISLLLAAGVTTGVIVMQAESMSSLARAISVEVQFGPQFLILEWITALLAIVGSVYWLVVWFVEFRTLAFSRRRRSDEEIGNWKGTWSELMQDLRGDHYKVAMEPS